MLRAVGVLTVSCLLAVSWIVPGCADTSSDLTVISVPTLLTADPRFFLGGVRCGAPELQSYVVAVTDVTTIPTPLAVSSPATCPNPTSFGSPPVNVGNLYTAQIDGYDRPVCDLPNMVFPPGCIRPSAAGARDQIDNATGAVVPPRFRWQCGVPQSAPVDASADISSGSALRAPARVLYSTEVFLQGCEPLSVVPSTDAGSPDASDCGPAGCDAAADDMSDEGVTEEPNTATESGVDAADQDAGETTSEPTDATDSGG
jgi:hypothetical protein